MKFCEALLLMGPRPIARGYRVHFEWKEGSLLVGDFFPDRSEDLIPTEDHAWELAARFAAATVGRCVNIYVIDEKHAPVPGYRERKIENRRPADVGKEDA